ncbi:MAG: acylphosphatase [Conexivisphaerales archaeon]
MTKRVKLKIYGIVQGVGFRYFVRRQAIALGLAGYARNMPDGSVEVALEGEDEAVDMAVDACRIGPPSSTVTRVEVEEVQPINQTGFKIE